MERQVVRVVLGYCGPILLSVFHHVTRLVMSRHAVDGRRQDGESWEVR